MNIDELNLSEIRYSDVTANELAHYGILGMKWGVTRTPEQLESMRITKGARQVKQLTSNVNSREKSNTKIEAKTKKLLAKKMKWDKKKFKNDLAISRGKTTTFFGKNRLDLVAKANRKLYKTNRKIDKLAIKTIKNDKSIKKLKANIDQLMLDQDIANLVLPKETVKHSDNTNRTIRDVYTNTSEVVKIYFGVLLDKELCETLDESSEIMNTTIGEIERNLSDDEKVIAYAISEIEFDDDAFEHSSISNDEYLEHYGVKGMKWGITRTKEQLARAKNQNEYNQASAKLASQEQALRGALSNGKTLYKNRGILTDKEISTAIKDMKMSGKYKDLNYVAGKLGSEYVNKALGKRTTEAAKKQSETEKNSRSEKSVKDLTDKELSDIIRRMENEKKYSDYMKALNPVQKSTGDRITEAGKKLAIDALNTAGKKVLTDVANHMLSNAAQKALGPSFKSSVGGDKKK